MSIAKRKTTQDRTTSVTTRFNSYGVLTTPDGRHTFGSSTDKSTAEIQFARIGKNWIAEYRYRFYCGRYQGFTLPLSAKSVPLASKEEAVADAARRLIADARAKCPDVASLPPVQQKKLAALIEWAEAFILAPSPVLPLAKRRFIDLCAGIGGFHVALKRQGATCVAACELDKAARETYEANHGNGFKIHDDIRTLDAATIPPFDILCAGFPCQSFSVAGDQQGYDAPEKGGLFFEIVRIAAACRPALLILENVKAFATHDSGKTATQALDALAEIGYATSMEVLDSSEFGVPQKRERLFLVAHRIDLFRPKGNPFAFPVGTDPSKVVADILETGIKAGQCATKMTTPKVPKAINVARTNRVGLIGGKNMQGYRVYSPLGKGITLCAESGGPGHKTGLYLVDGKPRRLIPRECASMQGFPTSFKLHPSATQACKQFGNSVAVPVVAAVTLAAAKFL